MSVQDVNGSIKQQVEYETYDDNGAQRNIILWTIPNFNSILNNKDISEIRTLRPKSTEQQPDECQFHLKIKFVGVESKWIEIYFLAAKSENLQLVNVHFGRDSCGEQYTVISKVFHTIEANKWQYLTNLSEVRSESKENLSEILLRYYNNTLYLTIEFKITIIEDDKQNSLAPTLLPPVSQLINDLENLFNNSIYSDVVVTSADGEEFRVHKGILASRSPVLKAFFAHNFNESITNTVESPLESEVLREVLSFIYTDRAMKIDEFPEKLLAAADYYQLTQLKSISEEALSKKLTVDNAIDILKLADLHSAKTLKQQTLEFIKYDEQQFQLIMKTEGWSKLQSVDLVKEICYFDN